MALNEDCLDRLRNWKFASAFRKLDDAASEEESALVSALAVTFGNAGWFDGQLGVIIGAAVDALCQGKAGEQPSTSASTS